jgi:DNA-binding NarL/FixJ family response regulator
MSPTPETINVWIIEDNLAFSRNASAAINVADGLRCTLAFRSCEEALKSLKTADPPQVVLMDIGLPGMSGIEGIVRLRESAPGAEVVVLTSRTKTSFSRPSAPVLRAIYSRERTSMKLRTLFAWLMPAAHP